MDPDGDPDESLILYVQQFVESQRSRRMVNPTILHWSMFATVFAMMAHFVVHTVSLWQGKVVPTSAGASRSVSKELLLGKMRCLEESMWHVACRLLRYTL